MRSVAGPDYNSFRRVSCNNRTRRFSQASTMFISQPQGKTLCFIIELSFMLHIVNDIRTGHASHTLDRAYDYEVLSSGIGVFYCAPE